MTEQTAISPRAWTELALLALIWGGSFLAIGVAVREVPVFWVVAIRVGGADLALWVYLLARGLRLPLSPRFWGAALVMGLFNNVLPFTLIAWGELHIASGLAAIVNAATAIFGVLIAALVFADEKLTPRKSVGVTLGFLGVATSIGLANLVRLDPTSLAQWALVAASLCYGVSGSWARAFLKGVPPQVAATAMLTCSTAVMVPVALLWEGVPDLAVSAGALAGLAYLALFASAAAYLLFYRVLASAGAGNVSLVTLLVAPVAILLGAVVLGEDLHLRAYAGFALLALGLVLLDGRLWRRLTRRRMVVR